MKISIHQPYFAPYCGHFRLLSDVDLHVVLDDVQHIRRGFIHRNRLPDANGRFQWLTLPLEKCPQETLICDLRFANDAFNRMDEQLARFPIVKRLPDEILYSLFLLQTGEEFVPYVIRLLQICADYLGIKTKMMLASELNLPRELRGKDRIIAICQLLGATHYLNSPGGRSLYDESDFAEAGINLEFLPEWQGYMGSVLHTLAREERKAA